jgi:hypothetical protein
MMVAQKTGTLSRMTLLASPAVPMTEALKPLWVFDCEDEIRGSPAIDNGIIYIGAYDNNLYILRMGLSARPRVSPKGTCFSGLMMATCMR